MAIARGVPQSTTSRLSPRREGYSGGGAVVLVTVLPHLPGGLNVVVVRDQHQERAVVLDALPSRRAERRFAACITHGHERERDSTAGRSRS
jgi:hypothetical protein